MAYPPGAGFHTPCSKVDLRISCKNLLDTDVMSKSDPCAVMFMMTRSKWYEIGRTENIKNCLDPNFTRVFEVDYFFEEVQKLMFAVYDLDNKTPELSDDDFLGQIECTLGQVVSNSPYKKPLKLRNGKNAGRGTITITAEEQSGCTDILNLSFRAEKLDKKDFLGKSDPYLEFSRENIDGTWQVVHRTEVIKNTLNPKWRTAVIKSQKLCGGDVNKMIRVTCYDWDSDESDLIGWFDTTVVQLKQAIDREIRWPCINPKKKAKKHSYKDSGTVILTSCKITREFSFLEYLFGGLQINMSVGVDFTASNGDPRNPQSLHFINPYQPNEYMEAINSVGQVIQDYDSDKMFPALGFGARIPPNMEVSHEFALNFQPTNPFCAGIQGVLEAYKYSISQVHLSGPTNFSPMIHHVAQFAAAAQREPGAKNYFILLILTDGVISDMAKTKEAIVHASKLPMSIIIVGVGMAEFDAMNELDGDDGVLRSPRGEPVARDIVQFVPFRDFKGAPTAELARQVLAEVPGQVTGYYKRKGIPPNPRPAAPPTGPPTAPPTALPTAPPPS